MNYATALPSRTAPGAPSPLAASFAPPPLPWQRLPLPPSQAAQALDIRQGETALLEVEQGRVWVTCDGRPEDHFLDAGQRLSFLGPVRLRVSAEGAAARLYWARCGL
jgi:hypothetical protein